MSIKRTALQTFRLFAEPLSKSVLELTKDQTDAIFNELSINMYPKNLERREWCVRNLNLFYDNAMEYKRIYTQLKLDQKNDKMVDSMPKLDYYD